MESNSIVIFGGGLIGQQWSMLFIANKFTVSIYDVSATQIENAKVIIKKSLEKFSNENISRKEENNEAQYNRLKFTTVLNEVPRDAAFVMECVVENIEIKKEVFKIIDSHFNEETIRMSSSSCIPISMFTSDLYYKHRCIITHPVNPPYFLRLVEIVPAPYTDRFTIDKVKLLMENIGQVTIELKKEVEGFAVNRIQGAVYNSIFNLLKNDIVSVSDIDKILTEGLAPRWTFFGPMLISVLNGPGAYNYFTKYLPASDRVNLDQGYPPQHDHNTIERIIEEMKHYDTETLTNIYEKRDSLLGKLLKIKKDTEKD